MTSSAANPPARLAIDKHPINSHLLLLILIGMIFIVAICIAAVLLIRHWPFSESAVIEGLREVSDSQIKVQYFRETYFPPGCVAKGVVFIHDPSAAQPLISIDELTVQGSYWGMMSHHVNKVIADGLRASIPAFGTGASFHRIQSKITISEFIANGSEIDFALRQPGKQPLRFDIHEADLRELGWGKAFSYSIRVHTSEPPGEVTAKGKFGSWDEQHAGDTPISGQYTFRQADLGVYRGIAGTLSSRGKFEGKLKHIDISGNTDVPDFEVKSSGHPVHLTTHFAAYVDALHGDTFLKHVDVDFEKTHLAAAGSVARSPNGKGKTLAIDLQSQEAHLEDILFLFVTARRSPMWGAISFQAHVEVTPGMDQFLKKVKLGGDFGIGGAWFSNGSTQRDVNILSAGARGEKKSQSPEMVLTNLKGRVDLLDGVATFHGITFHIPGAASRLHGTYSLINEKIDLRGQMRVDTEIANTETGVKNLLLKFIQPFFRRKKKGQIVPVRIAGTYDHPTFGLDLKDKRAQLHPLHADRTDKK